jgi:hypothetical protein
MSVQRQNILAPSGAVHLLCWLVEDNSIVERGQDIAEVSIQKATTAATTTTTTTTTDNATTNSNDSNTPIVTTVRVRTTRTGMFSINTHASSDNVLRKR